VAVFARAASSSLAEGPRASFESEGNGTGAFSAKDLLNHGVNSSLRRSSLMGSIEQGGLAPAGIQKKQQQGRAAYGANGKAREGQYGNAKR